MKTIRVIQESTKERLQATISKKIVRLSDGRVIAPFELIRDYVAILDYREEDGTRSEDIAHFEYLKNTSKGEYIRLTASGSVYVREEYDRREQKYAISNTNDMNNCKYLDGDTIVLIGFTY